MRIGFLQINPVVGDMAGNAARLAAGYARLVAAGAQVVVAPELALNGYPPRDLVLKSRFVSDTREQLEELAKLTQNVPFLVGFVAENTSGRGNPYVNAVALLEAGQVRQELGKTRLPTYDVFDEARYFEPSPAVEVVELAGIPCGITVCEDIWEEEYLPGPIYRRDPAQELVTAGAQILFNLSASPFHLGKPALRVQMLGQKSARTRSADCLLQCRRGKRPPRV